MNVPAWICEIGIQCGCSPRGLVRFHRFRIVRHTGRLTSYDAPEARSDLVYPISVEWQFWQMCIMLSNVQFFLKVLNDNIISREFPGVEGIEVTYHRCQI